MNNGQLEMCCVYDSKSESWQNPMCFLSRGQAMRSFGDAVNNVESDFHRHPEDYLLFHVGAFYPRTGEVVSLNGAEVICKGVDVKECEL